MRKVCVLIALLFHCSAAFGLVITEIMYNQPPTAADPEGVLENLEFIELYNDKAGPEDLSGFKFTEGIHYVFTSELQGNGRPVASLGPREYLVLAKDAVAFEAHYGFAPFGQYEGQLSNSGDTIMLENDAGDPYDPVANTRDRIQGAEVINFRYNDSGKWPTACDGTGHTLCLINPFMDMDDADSWVPSPVKWGTPGASNGLTDEWVEETIFPAEQNWRYRKGNTAPPSTWKDQTYNDASWILDQAPIGYGDDWINTDLDDMQNTYASIYGRYTFDISNPSSFDSLVLSVRYDDGFVAYINGTEVCRDNVDGSPPAHDTLANGNHEATSFDEFDISAFVDELDAQDNVLAIEIHNTQLSSSDSTLDAMLIGRKVITGGGASTSLVINEAFFKNTTGTQFVEIFNNSGSSVNLSDYYISSDPSDLDAQPLSGSIPAYGFLSVVETAAFSLDLEFQDPPPEPPDVDYGTLRVFVTYIPGGNLDNAYVAAAETFSGRLANNWAEARMPDGGPNWFKSSNRTPGAANELGTHDVNRDIVINEIMYHPFREDNPYITEDDALYDRNLEYIELYNRGSTTVDLSGWRFSRGVEYNFPAGVSMTPGAYLVVASNPERIREVYGLSEAVTIGPYFGGLSNDGEKLRLRDVNNNIVDEVRYYDAGRWDKWADGLGSSLELIDPNQDNDFPGAWKASDESGKSEWTTVTYYGNHNEVRSGESEFHMFLMGKGEILLDNLEFSTSSSFSTNLIRGGGDFNSSSDYTSYWSRGGEAGNHIDTHWTNEDSYAGAGCLKIIASGRGDSHFNRLESDTSSGLSSTRYYVRYRARWLRGFNLFMTRTHGHNVARAAEIAVPENLGTPGAQNSAFQANQGPVYDFLNQEPAVPAPSQPVVVTVEIRDSDGVNSALLRYRNTGTTSSYSQATMNDSGTGSDEKAGDNVWTGVIPGHASNTVIEFYVAATDGDSNQTQHPPLTPAVAPSTVENDLAIYRVGDNVTPGGKALYRITLTHDGEDALDTRRTLSNHLVPCSFVLNESKIIYNCGFRLRGSPFIRRGGIGEDRRNGLRVRFPADDPLFGVMNEVNLDGSGHSNMHDRTAYYLERKVVAATPGVYQSWSWGRYVDVRYRAGSHAFNGMYDHLQKIDADYQDNWWGRNGDGYLHKVDDWFEFNDSGGFSNWQANMTYGRGSQGDNKEFWYRQNFKLRSREKEDDYSHLIHLCYALTNWSDAKLDSDIRSIMDVAQWSAILAPRYFIDDWDTLGARRGKNAYIYYPSPVMIPENPEDPESPQVLSQEQWCLIPWDSDLTFGNQGAQIEPGTQHFPEMTTLYSRPWAKRMLFANYEYLISDVVRSPVLAAWCNWMSSAVSGVSGTGLPGWCEGRATNIEGRIPNSDNYPFDILSPRGNPYVANTPTVMVEGQAPYTISIITLDEVDITHQLTWSGNDGLEWGYGPLALAEGLNEFAFRGYSRTGELVATKMFRVLYTDEDPPAITAIHPAEGVTIGGETVTITGTNLLEGLEVKLDDQVMTNVTWVSETEVQFVTPPHSAGNVTVSVVNPDGLPGFYEYFEYIPIPAPVITHVLPPLGHTGGGTRVQIRGHYFQQGAEVYFGSAQADTVVVHGLQEIEVIVPPHAAGPVDVRVRNVDDQDVVLDDGFRYVSDEAPRLLDVTPPEGPSAGGTTITISGEHFQQGAVVWVGSRLATNISFVSATELTCRTPLSHVGDTFVSVRVENPDSQFDWMPSAYRYVDGVKSCNSGDANGDGVVDLADGVAVLEQLFRNGSAVLCKQAADANDDGKMDIADAIVILSRLFPAVK